MRTLLFVVALVPLVAYAAGPADQAATVPPPPPAQGYPSASYQIESWRTRLGDVTVRAADIAPTRFADGVYPAAHLIVDLRNQSKAPMALDLPSTKLAVLLPNGQELDASPERVDGVVTAPPREVTRVDLYFRLPQQVANRIDGMHLTWMVSTNHGLYRTVTPFSRQPGQERAAWYATPGYDPVLFGAGPQFNVVPYAAVRRVVM